VSGRRIEDGVEEVDGRGGGEAAPGTGRPAAARGKKKGARPEKGGGAGGRGRPDGWAPPVCEREREEGERRRWRAGLGRKQKWAAGWVGLGGCFLFFFKSNFKPISNLLNSNLFIFSNSNFNTNFSTI
jgi:hypothetical protein